MGVETGILDGSTEPSGMQRNLDNLIKVGFCVAYDWGFLAHSLPLVYKSSDLICLSIDRDRLSWASKAFAWNESEFRNFIKSIDKDNKILIYEDNFHLPDLSPAENEIRQRRLMAERMGSGGWHVQLDCDEYFLDFDGFVQYLKRRRNLTSKRNITCQLITVFKQVNGGYLYVYPTARSGLEFLQVASKHPEFEHGRRNGHFNVFSGFMILHQSWARNESEIMQKLLNWGHMYDFNVNEYFALWRDVTRYNFDKLKDFHPMKPKVWPALRFVKSKDVNELISIFKEVSFPSLHPFKKTLRNSILLSGLVSRIKSICGMVFRRRTGITSH